MSERSFASRVEYYPAVPGDPNRVCGVGVLEDRYRVTFPRCRFADIHRHEIEAALGCADAAAVSAALCRKSASEIEMLARRINPGDFRPGGGA